MCANMLLSGETPIPESRITATSALIVDGVSTDKYGILGTVVDKDKNINHAAWSTADGHLLTYYIEVTKIDALLMYILSDNTEPVSLMHY